MAKPKASSSFGVALLITWFMGTPLVHWLAARGTIRWSWVWWYMGAWFGYVIAAVFLGAVLWEMIKAMYDQTEEARTFRTIWIYASLVSIGLLVGLSFGGAVAKFF